MFAFMNETDTPKNLLDPATKRLIKDPKARRAWGNYQLALRGTNMARLAKDAGITRTTAYQVWCRPYPRIERLVSAAIGVRPQDLFPERYDPTGKPSRRMGRPPKKSTHTKAKNNSRAATCNDKAKDAT